MTFDDLRLGFSKVIHYQSDLGRCEILGTSAVMNLCQGFLQRVAAVNPAHQVVVGRAGVAVGEIEHGKLLFAVAADFHFNVEC